jgi:hypothetical protein
VKGVPSWNFTLRRSLNSQVRSSMARHDCREAGLELHVRVAQDQRLVHVKEQAVVGRQVVIVRIHRGHRRLQADRDLAILGGGERHRKRNDGGRCEPKHAQHRTSCGIFARAAAAIARVGP